MKNNLLFLKSSQITNNAFNSTTEVIEWLKEKNNSLQIEINRCDLKNLDGWKCEYPLKKISHNSGGFFSIVGIDVQTNWGSKSSWSQPIINQPEIGYLGFITKEFDGVLYFLAQAKIEPGNINYVQLSPTLQATKSNYTQKHKGKTPNYLSYFQDRNNNEILSDQLQSEQGARFLSKRNRNIIIKISEEIEILDDFCWLTLGQINELLRFDNLVNMDTRTIISGIQLGSYDKKSIDLYMLMREGNNYTDTLFLKSELSKDNSYNSMDQIIHWFTNLKTIYELNVKTIPLDQLSQWIIDKDRVYHVDNKYFEVIGVEVVIENREVIKWSQPLISPVQSGICAFIVKVIDGIAHFLVQAKMEVGNFDVLEFAPTVQCVTGSYSDENSLNNLPYLNYVLNAPKSSIVLDTYQSEEGGRFYREQNRNLIILADDNFELELSSNYIWISLHQLKMFLKFNNYLNIQARSLLSLIPYNKTSI